MSTLLGAATIVVFLLVWAMTGHLLWVLGRLVVRAIAGDTDRWADSVPASPFEPARSTASDTKRLEELSRQVQQLCDAGAVSMDACDRMQALLRREIAAQSPAVISPVPPAPAAASDDTPRSTRTFACNTAASPSTEDNNFVTAELVTTVAADDTAAPVVVRSWKDVLRSFMEERNIRWGEIISGILIVGCAIGLVISLWATLRDTIPYFPAMIFALFTSALYGAGYYTMRRWRLTSTSRGLLVIALLLIPLNFLAGIALRGPGHPLDLLSWLAMGIGLALFSWMSYSASRLLLAECPWQLALATMGPALAQLVVSRVGVDELNTVSTTLLTLLISAGVLVSLGATVWQTRSRSHMSASTAWHLLAVTGLGFFSATISFGLLLHVNPHRAFVLAASSPAVSLVAMMVVTVGIALHVRCREPSTATFRMAGTATALLGGIFAVRNVVCAWPHPEFLVAVGLICFVCLTLLAVVGRLPTLHGPALVCGVIAYLIVVYLIRGDLSTPSDRLASTMLQLAGRGVTAVALMFASFVLGGTVSVWKRFPKIGATAPYATAGMVTGTGSLIIAIYATLASHTPRSLGVIGLAPHDADYATLIFFTYAALAFGLGWVRNNKWSVAIASVLLLMAWEHAFLANTTVLRLAPFIDHIFRPAAAALVANSLCLSVTAAVHHRWLSLRTESGVASTGETAACGNVSRIAISISLWRLSLVAIGLATCCVVAPSMQGFRYQSLYLTVLSLSWFIIGWGTRRKLATAGIQWSVSLASGYYLAHAGTGTWWRLPETGGWLFLWATSLLAAAWVPVWVLTRRLLLQATRRTDGTGTWHELIQPHAWSTERILALSTVAVTSILSIHYTVHFDDSPVSNIQLWVLWLATLSATVLSSGRRWNEHSIAALTVLFGTMPLLAGVPFSSQWTLLGALAWTFATATLFGAFAEWNRSAIDKLLSRFGIAVNPFDDDTRWALRAAIVTFTYVPAFALVMINIGRHVPLLATITLAPPLLENRWLDALYWSGPLSVVGASTLGHAIRGTNSRMLFLGGVVFQIFACTLSLIAFPPPSVPWTGDVPVRCLQVVTISSAIFLLLWVALYPSMVRRRTAVSLDSNIELAAQDDTFWFYTQTTLVLSCIVLLTLLSFSAVLFPRMIAANGTTASMIVQLSHPAGWWAWAFTVLGFLVSAGRLPSRVTLHHFLFVGLQCIGLIASFQASSPSLRIVTLLWGVVALALCCTALASLPKLSTSRKDDVFEPTTFGRNANIWVYVLGVFGVVVAFRAAVEGATETCIASHAVGVIAIAFFTHGMLGNHRTALALSYATGVVGGLFAWLGYKLDPWISLVDLELGVLSAIGIAWSVYRIVMERSGRAAGRDVGSVLDAWVAGSTTTILLMRSVLLFTIHGLSKAYHLGIGSIPDVGLTSYLLPLLLVGLLLASMSWRRGGPSTWSVPMLYVLFVAAIVQLGTQFAPTGETRVIATTAGLGAWAAVTGMWYHGRQQWARRARWVHIESPDRIAAQLSRWLPLATGLLSIVTLLLSLAVTLTFIETWQRTLGALAPFALGASVAFQADGPSRLRRQIIAMALALWAVILVRWASIDPGLNGTTLLAYVVRTLMALSAVTFLYAMIGSGWEKWFGDWRRPARITSWYSGAVAVLVLGLVLAVEAYLFSPQTGVPINAVVLGEVLALLTLLLVGLIVVAVNPARDPWSLTEDGRMGYVYAAQGTLVAMFIHAYLARPQLFRGLLTEYWPFVVLAIAYAGISISLLARRMGYRVLAEPLERTGIFLPMIPIIGWWIQAADHGTYSMLLFAGASLYLSVGILRRSIGLTATAIVVGNLGFWAFLGEHSLWLTLRPQFWLVPPATTVLVAAHINRHRLPAATLSAIRYVSLIVIYVSSTSEVFLNGVGTSLWPPVVLIILSLVGVVVGIAARARSFLYMGTTFTLVAVITMVWHASRHIGHVWPWWAFGIGLGVAILAALVTLEKQRKDPAHWIDSLHQWKT